MSAELRRLSYQEPAAGIKVQLCALRVIIVQQVVAILVLARTYSRPWQFGFQGRNEKGWGMSNYSSYLAYCQDQAADCARRARLARTPAVEIYCRGLELRWLRLAKQAQETSAPSWTHQAPLGQATPRRLTDKARPSNVRLLAKIYSSIEADALTLGRSSC
jgi:hypothetical protein